MPDPEVGGTRQYLLACPTALASLGCQRCGTAKGLWEAFPRRLQRQREAGCSSAGATQIHSICHQIWEGVRLLRHVYRGLFTVYSPFAMKKLRKKGQLGCPVSMQERESPRCWVPLSSLTPWYPGCAPTATSEPVITYLGARLLLSSCVARVSTGPSKSYGCSPSGKQTDFTGK